MTDLLSDEWRVARKAHGCNACLGTIGPGDRYYRQRVKDGGDLYSFKEHGLCAAAYWLALDAGDIFYDESPSPEEVQEVVLRFFAALASHAPQVAQGESGVPVGSQSPGGPEVEAQPGEGRTCYGLDNVKGPDTACGCSGPGQTPEEGSTC